MKGVALKFGLFAVFTVLLTAYIGAQIAKIQFGDTYSVRATFDDVSGLSDGDDVKVAGVKVGQVSGIDTDDEGRAVVTLSLDEDVPVPDDSEAAVRWRNLLGQRVVYLYPGESSRNLSSGDEIERTRSVVDIGALIDELGGVVSAVDPVQFNSLMTAIAGALDGNEARVGQLLDSAGTLLQALRSRDDTIAGLLDDFNTVSGALADRDQQIRSMVENLTLLTEAFADNEQLVESTLSELGRYSTSLDRVLTGNEQQLLSIVGNLDRVTDMLVDNRDAIDAQLANLPEALEALHEVTNKGTFIVVQALCFSTGPPPCPTPITPDQPPQTVLATAPDALAAMSPVPPPDLPTSGAAPTGILGAGG